MKSAIEYVAKTIEEIKEQGLYKSERIITTPQRDMIDTTTNFGVINMCANNYLGLPTPQGSSGRQRKPATGGGTACLSPFHLRDAEGTQGSRICNSGFLGMEDTILYSSCFDANGGLFEPLLGENDAVISDELNHASIIDGIRLCKASKYKYKNNDMEDLRRQLEAAKDARIKLIVTDGVFSMDGYIANLKEICDLADEFDALVAVDDSHAVGFMGKNGRGTHEYCGVMGRVDIITGTLGKALGGASGGYVSAKKEIVELLRQRSRPYLFSNTLAPAIAAASLEVIKMLGESSEHRDMLHENTAYFREKMESLGFDILPGTHPIVPIMLYDARIASEFSARLLEKGVYVTGFPWCLKARPA